MTELNQRVALGQELDISQYVDSSSSGVVTALPVSNQSTVKLTGAVTSIQGIAGSGLAQALLLINATGSSITIANANVGASAANRILTGLGSDLTLQNDGEVLLQYDPSSLRWRIAGSGAQGPQGSQGAQGVQGLQGSQGAQGSTGAQGLQGSTGAQGLQGSTGAQGLQGSTGAQGAQGDTGAQGLQGSTGAQGLQGSQGSQGAQGFQGSQGAQGFQGAVPVSAPNNGTNATFVPSGQYPASAGATATNDQSCSVTVTNTSMIMFCVWVGSAGSSSWFLGAADYASADISALSDITGLFLSADAGTGIYVSKSANSNQLTFKNKNLGSVAVVVQFFNASISSATAWA